MTKQPSDFGGLFSARRVLVVGANGAGKTWLANRLGEGLGLPATHNDALSLTTGWVQRNRNDVRTARDRIAAGDTWVIEGGPSILSGISLIRAEAVIWLDVPRHVRTARVLRRSILNIGKQRPEHPPGNRDWPGQRQFRFALKSWTHDAAARTAIERALSMHQDSFIRLRHQREVMALNSALTRR